MNGVFAAADDDDPTARDPRRQQAASPRAAIPAALASLERVEVPLHRVAPLGAVALACRTRAGRPVPATEGPPRAVADAPLEELIDELEAAARA